MWISRLETYFQITKLQQWLKRRISRARKLQAALRPELGSCLLLRKLSIQRWQLYLTLVYACRMATQCFTPMFESCLTLHSWSKKLRNLRMEDQGCPAHLSGHLSQNKRSRSLMELLFLAQTWTALLQSPSTQYISQLERMASTRKQKLVNEGGEMKTTTSKDSTCSV